ncbi:uncharacterized protein CTRU02_209079 [Colletotrichum truncatum]|uniref:Uncharacterized protein n=1 Tax=Colletotrichum truncatum TaxID=5467 RepID=A0ACC3YY15_COLTU|nr:uncharacterized protein CTRU02_07730 [Colletotrichum truncatum]KAF6790824.1 hypothetical protein CTRU02_07730 [Colletotrichum truncatum]
MRYAVLLLLGIFAFGVLADRHHFCWCESHQVGDHDTCLTQAACSKYPQDRFFGVQGGDSSASTITKMSWKRQECYSTRAWPIIPHPFLGGKEFKSACVAAATDESVVNACGFMPGERTGIRSVCSEPFD